MSREIAVVADYITEEYRAMIDRAAGKTGFPVSYYRKEEAKPGDLDNAEVLYGQLSKELISSAKSAKWVCLCQAGVEAFAGKDLYRNPDCILTGSSGAYGTTIAEHLVMVVLMLFRRQPEYTEMMRKGGWGLLPGDIRSLYGARVTILGAGDIGTEFARRIKAFHPAKIVGVRRSGKPGDPVYDGMRTIDELDNILPETDLLVMALPGTGDTSGILSRERIALLPKTAFLVNVGRGSAIDQDALMGALNGGQLSGAALDVMVPEPLPADHPLRRTKNLLLTPHVAGNLTLEVTRRRSVELFCENLENYAAGKPMRNVFDRERGY